jgi:hypothetical protein
MKRINIYRKEGYHPLDIEFWYPLLINDKYKKIILDSLHFLV